MQDKARQLLHHPMPVARGMVCLLTLIRLMQEYHQWQALTTGNPAPKVINQSRIVQLFGASAAPSCTHPQKTNLPLKLLGSSVNVDLPQRQIQPNKLTLKQAQSLTKPRSNCRATYKNRKASHLFTKSATKQEARAINANRYQARYRQSKVDNQNAQ